MKIKSFFTTQKEKGKPTITADKKEENNCTDLFQLDFPQMRLQV